MNFLYTFLQVLSFVTIGVLLFGIELVLFSIIKVLFFREVKHD
jgi:hypothetical protein